METITTKTNIYKFNELSEEAKEKAREWMQACNCEDDFWSEQVIEDATIIADIFGLTIENIYFSGFSSQGDGACFVGSYEYKKQGLKNIISHAPLDKELRDIVKNLQTIQRKAFYQLTAKTDHRGRYNHSGYMFVNVCNEKDYNGWPTDEQEQDLTDELRCFADWIYNRLESEWNWLNEDEQIDESITTNEYDFTEDGTIY